MNPAAHPTPRAIRRDGWTPDRRQRFLALLAAGTDVRRACAAVGLSRRAAYNLRAREPAFAQAWDEGQRLARLSADHAFLAMLPPALRQALWSVPGACELQGTEGKSQDSVNSLTAV